MKVAAEIRRVDSKTGGKWTQDASWAREIALFIIETNENFL